MAAMWPGDKSYRLLRIEAHESGVRPRSGWLSCKIGENVKFSADVLTSYCFAKWEPVVFDALLVAAVIEFADRSQGRPTHHWAREFHVRVPVHEPRRWADIDVAGALHNALNFMTGDRWRIEFVPRKKEVPSPRQSTFSLPSGSGTIIPFSDGLDSYAVSGLVQQTLGDKLLRVRLGSKISDVNHLPSHGQLFASVPYQLRQGARRFAETSVRSRGFKFATISGLAAYLAKAEEIVVPESGQGALGPTLVPVGQTYEDYRNHPLFTDAMEAFFEALLHYRPRFGFPRLWFTKGETLKELTSSSADAEGWTRTWSCWQSARQVSVNGRKRQCGICAACMLRRQSVHAAGLREAKDTYVWENLRASSFEQGAAQGFGHITKALREYAIAGTLHLDHLAALQSSATGRHTIEMCAFPLAQSRKMNEADVKAKLERLLAQHETEWRAFVRSLGKRSFVADWAPHTR